MEGTSDELWQMLGALHQDVNQAGENLQQEDIPYNRRAYVRAALASIEAITFDLKQEALGTPKKNIFSQSEKALLLEGSYSLDGGEPRTSCKFLRLEGNFIFAVAIYSRAIGSPFVLEKGNEWQAFKSAIAVRNRITHPKRPGLLAITDEEIQLVALAYQWVIGTMISSLSAGNAALCSEVERMAKEHGIAV
jgi:hypothetical protein